MSKTKPFGADRCINCGEYGAHFVPPSMGDKGFFICTPKEEHTNIDNRLQPTSTLTYNKADDNHSPASNF